MLQTPRIRSSAVKINNSQRIVHGQPFNVFGL
nr:MAG TPA: hypothetical protein [Caudoviricetes sp.]